jgi:hypothetical protein
MGQSTVTYRLEPTDGGTRITLRRGEFATPEATDANAIGWETSLRRLAETLGSSTHVTEMRRVVAFVDGQTPEDPIPATSLATSPRRRPERAAGVGATKME